MDSAFSATERRNSTSDRLKPAPVFTHPVTFHYEIQNHTTRMQKLTKAFRVYRLMVLTLICVLAGILVGLMCRRHARTWNERRFMYIEFPGELYLRFLRLLIIPLLVSNVILSFGTIQGKISSRLGKVAGALYLASNVVAITVAIVCAVCVLPGAARQHTDSQLSEQIQNHHYLRHYHDSITRYREYHPMFYHTNRDGDLPDDSARLVRSAPAPSLPIRSGGVSGVKYKNNHNSNNNNNDDKSFSEQAQQADDEEPLLVVRASQRDEQSQRESNRVGPSTKLPIDVVLDVLRNVVPDSLVGAALQQSRTRLFAPKELHFNSKDGSTEPAPNNWPMGHEMVDQPNIIGLLAMSVLTGVVLSRMGEASKPLLDLCSCVSELSLRIGMKAIHLAPFCIMFLLVGQVARARDLNLIAGELLWYSLTVGLALLIHGFIMLPLVYYFVTKKSPLDFFKGMLEALVASFATSSSSATMALTLNCLSGLNLNLVIVRAFGPLGSVFNMNGTSIFEAIAVIFIAQNLNVKLSLTSLLLVGLCAAVASLSTAGIPSSGMMTMVIVLNAINLPVLELSLIYIVDFIIDRFRTVINVWSGALVCGLINHICPEGLFEEEMRREQYREMIKYRASCGSLSGRKSLATVEEKPQVISVTITPPNDESSKI